MHARCRSHLATYSGKGGEHWLEDEGWVGISKQELVEPLRSGRVSVVLATDSASEGLNLQAANYLINYDLPWNPMRVEQRIGRIDRIGQPAPVATVRNYVIPGTVEESVSRALADRIDIWTGLLGKLQPILGATEAAFRQIFRAPRSERQQVERAAIDDLMARVDELERSGIDLIDEDPLPDRDDPQAPVTLDELRRCLTEELDIALDSPERPVTFTAERASRDAERWTALATYGHPALEVALRKIAESADPVASLVLNELDDRAVAYRADRTPPERVMSVSDLLDLGEPLAAGEARELAMRDVRSEIESARTRAATLARTHQVRWEDGVRRQLRLLVIRTINAEVTLQLRRDGEAPDATIVWLEIGGDTQTGWAYADKFRQYLGMQVAELLPTGPAGADPRGDRELQRVRVDTGRVLLDLIDEWKQVAATVD